MTDTPNPSSPFVRNVVLLSVVGVAALGWVLRYTDWFTAIAGVFALGGAFSWIAVVLRVLKKERLQRLQDWADGTILENPRTSYAVVAIGALLAVAMSFAGTVEVKEEGSTVARTVTFSDPTSAVPFSEDRLTGTLRRTFFTSWWSPRSVRVKLNGLPATTVVTVRPWSVTTVAPPDFLRPVVILTPDEDLLTMVPQNPMTLVIRSDSRGWEFRNSGYRGEAVWVGCDASVSVPPDTLESWKTKLAARKQIQHLERWKRPATVPGVPQDLYPGEQISVDVLSGEATVFASAQIRVRPVTSRSEFPQEEEIHVPTEDKSSRP